MDMKPDHSSRSFPILGDVEKERLRVRIGKSLYEYYFLLEETKRRVGDVREEMLAALMAHVDIPLPHAAEQDHRRRVSSLRHDAHSWMTALLLFSESDMLRPLLTQGEAEQLQAAGRVYNAAFVAQVKQKEYHPLAERVQLAQTFIEALLHVLYPDTSSKDYKELFLNEGDEDRLKKKFSFSPQPLEDASS